LSLQASLRGKWSSVNVWKLKTRNDGTAAAGTLASPEESDWLRKNFCLSKKNLNGFEKEKI
jgi:hypothetical protein